MNKFTPGSWSSERDQVGPRSQEDDQSYGMLIPVAYIERFDHPENAEANKALIAAAPDLLEALEDLADSAPSACCVDFHHKPDDYHDADESCPALDRYEAACLSARAAIAKARGEA